MVKHLPAMRETQVQSLGGEDLLEKEMATCSSILAWKIPWTEEPSRLQSMGSQRVGNDSDFIFFLSPMAHLVKNPLANAGDVGSNPGSGRSPGEGNSNPFYYSCMGNPMDRGIWRATVHGVTKSQT